MIEHNKIKYYSPQEIAKNKLIVNSKGKGDYRLVLRLINNNKLPAINIGMGKTIYNMVSELDIKKFNSQRFKG